MSSEDTASSDEQWQDGDVVRDGAGNLFCCVLEPGSWFALPSNKPGARGSYRRRDQLVDPLVLLVRDGRAVVPGETDSDASEERKGVLADIEDEIERIYTRSAIDSDVEALAWQVQRLAALFGGRVLQ